MSSVSRLLDQLASLTAMRDLELMEFSLLKTLKGFLQPLGLRLIRLNGKGEPSMEIVYCDDKCIVRHDDLTLSVDMQSAADFLQASDARCYCVRSGAHVEVIFPLLASRMARNFLQIAIPRELSRMDMHMVEGVLQIYRNFVGLMQNAQTDQLTGLANRKTFDECVARVHELIPDESVIVTNERRGSKSGSYWLIMVDIDHFKSVNDRFGHLYGDEVLVILAQLMQASFREHDLIFRFGGEEFVLIVQCADIESCMATLERFRLGVAGRSIPQVGRITISMGVTKMERKTFPATMLDYADQALYHSKRNGRNRVTFFEDLVSQGGAKMEEIKTDEISFF
jgi:two-component system cell cycle response regulator